MPRRNPPGAHRDLPPIAARPCPFPACRVLIADGEVTCPSHWGTLPGRYRQQWITAKRQGTHADLDTARQAVKEYATTQTPTERTA